MYEPINNSMIPSAGTGADRVRTLEIIAGEIRTFTASMLNNIIEIGRRMCEAKEMLPYGQFGDWIKANTGYSRSTANNFMRVFQEYGTRQGSLFGAEVEDAQTFGKLSYTQALALLALPSGEREEFVETHDLENMSTRELRDAIRERDEARRALDTALADAARAEEFAAALTHERDEARKVMDDALEDAKKAEQEAEELRAQIKEIEGQPTTVEIDQDAIDKAVAAALEKASKANEAEMDKLRETERQVREDLKQQLRKAEAAAEKAKAAEARAKDKLKKAENHAGTIADIDGALAEQKAATEDAVKAREEAEKAKAEADELRRKLAMSGEATVTFKLYFAAWQKDYQNLMNALAQADDETASRLKAAINAQIEGWTNG